MPAMEMVVIRCWYAVLACAVMVTLPEPMPTCLFTLSHGVSLMTVHIFPAGAVTVMLADAPEAERLTD